MPCLIALVAFFSPRLVLVLMLLFSSWIGHAYTTVIWPVLGFLFMPWTTLAYAWAMQQTTALTGGYFFIVMFAALVDVGAVGGGYKTRRFFAREH